MYRGGLAQYYITQENEGIFSAHLTRYDGKADHYPPYKLTLIRDSRNWTGTTDDPGLIEGISKVIEKKLEDYNPLFPPSKKHKE